MKLLLLFLLPLSLLAQIQVGFTSYNEDIDKPLWEEISNEAGLSYNLVEYDELGEMLGDVKSGKLSAAMGGISITHKREKDLDFSVPYMNAGLKILINKVESPSYFKSMADMTFIKSFLSSITCMEIRVIGTWYLLFMVVMAHIVWASEQHNSSIDDKYSSGICQSLYYCVVTSSTVGYGDLTCKRFVGRVTTMFLILVGVAFFANLTGYIAAEKALQTVSQNSISNFYSLNGKMVATAKGETTSKEKLEGVGARVIPIEGVDWIEEAVKLLKAGKVDAVVYDSPLIDKVVKLDNSLLAIDKLFYPQYYGFVIESGSELKEGIDQAILKLIESK